MPADALVLLHGALFSPAQFSALKQLAESHFDVLTPAFPGHGGSSIPLDGFSISSFSESVLSVLDRAAIQRACVFGYSLGGYVALEMAIQHPDRILAVTTLGTKLDWNEDTAAVETRLLNPEKMRMKIPGFVSQLERIHHPTDWSLVVEEIANFLTELGKKPVLTTNRLSEVKCPVLMLNGALDQTASANSTTQWIKSIANGKAILIPDVAHPFDSCPTDVLWDKLKSFFLSLPQHGINPVH